jgi:hypothetical protein
MAKYIQEFNGERFEIDVDGLRLGAGQPATCFIARISTVNGKRPVWMVENGLCRREIYGRTEVWARRMLVPPGTRGRLDRRRRASSRGHHEPELISV